MSAGIDRYVNGDYLAATDTWHVEDSRWKALRIDEVLKRANIEPISVCDVGCGVGCVLKELSQIDGYESTRFEGFDISPQAIAAANRGNSSKVAFYLGPARVRGDEKFSVALMIDVFEHIPDYLGFLSEARTLAQYKVLHIPLDVHVSSVMRGALSSSRKLVGHLHYFSAETALATLSDCGYEVLDFQFTDGAVALFRNKPTMRRFLANIPRLLFGYFSRALAARLFGGYSLIVLAK